MLRSTARDSGDGGSKEQGAELRMGWPLVWRQRKGQGRSGRRKGQSVLKNSKSRATELGRAMLRGGAAVRFVDLS